MTDKITQTDLRVRIQQIIFLSSRFLAHIVKYLKPQAISSLIGALSCLVKTLTQSF